MNSRYKTVRIGPGRRLDDVVAELIVRSGRDVSRLGFSLADSEPETVQPAPAPEAAAERDAAAASEQMRLQLEAARAEGFLEARRSAETELETRLMEERKRLDTLRSEFARDRQRFFACAESQVVLLALAVASRVLQREVLADGLHLRATVKAALARVQDGSSTILRVPEEEAREWAAMFEGGSSTTVEVVPDDRMKPGDCTLHTNVGTVELGVDVQMEEIERGFSELMHKHSGGEEAHA